MRFFKGIRYERISIITRITQICMIYKPLEGRNPNGYAAYRMMDSNDRRVPITHLGPKEYKVEGDWYIPKQWRMGGYVLCPNITNQAYLYRGEAVDLDEDGNPPLKETGYQKLKFKHVEKVYQRIRWFDLRRLLQSNPMFRLLNGNIRLQERGRLGLKISSAALLHSYGVISSYVSMTSDLKIALFYAVTDYDKDNRRFVPTKKSHGILSHYKMTSPLSNSSRVTPLGLQVFERPGLNKEFLCRLRGEETFYTLPYVEGFLFKQDRELSESILAEFDNGWALCPPDDILGDRVAASEGVFSKSAFDFVSRFFPQYNKINLDDLLEKYQMTDTPSKYFKFTKEELEMCYSNIDYWWYEFCKKIYFPAAPELDEQFLMNLPYEEGYGRYFDQCRL